MQDPTALCLGSCCSRQATDDGAHVAASLVIQHVCIAFCHVMQSIICVDTAAQMH